MSTLRPIGHIAGRLDMPAMLLSQRLQHMHGNNVLQCWLTDDGCIYVAPSNHEWARTIARTAAHDIIATYRKSPDIGWRDILADLKTARTQFAERALHEAMHA